jgi:aromatic-L-amino-acid decarboxylase
LAHQVADAASDLLTTLADGRTFPATSAAHTAATFDQPLGEEGVGAAVFDDLTAIAAHSRTSTGRLFPYVVGSGDPVAALGDLYASVLNQTVTAWPSAPPGPSRWSARSCAGLPRRSAARGSAAV